MTDAIAYTEKPTPEKYAVVWPLPDGRIEYPGADYVSYDDDGYLTVGQRLVPPGSFTFGPHTAVIAIWAPGTWERAEVAERIPDVELRQDEPVAPSEPEEPAGPGTFEVFEDPRRDRYRWRLKTANGEVVASGQAYASRKGAHAGTAAVQRAAAGAPIIDLERE
ncbi:DUF1508 domain-containing protein [Tsukamurella sputi]|uniref:DUF1508 domain-containing protein n=1 Tax=Tsukamurella sputi TaxID=2591848 RepID=A0A5C5RNJ9_9ACTN|nr:DUF1508 domain-containing protein [Tsukamurella sputi]